MTQDPQNHSGQKTIVNQTEKQTNIIGFAGFVLALIAALLLVVTFIFPHFLDWLYLIWEDETFLIMWLLMWLLGLIFSLNGVFKKPKSLSVAGLVISLAVLFSFLIVFLYVFLFASRTW